MAIQARPKLQGQKVTFHVSFRHAFDVWFFFNHGTNLMSWFLFRKPDAIYHKKKNLNSGGKMLTEEEGTN